MCNRPYPPIAFTCGEMVVLTKLTSAVANDRLTLLTDGDVSHVLEIAMKLSMAVRAMALAVDNGA